MKIVTVLGARPQFVKAATVSRELKKAGLEEVIVHTGQHFDPNMSEVFFAEMEIPAPNHNLDIQGLNHGAMTGRMLEKTEEILVAEKPDCVLVYGDTNSTLAGALAAAKLHIPIAHVEAGLRSFDTRMPEEINRILTDRISQWLFCPTPTAILNLENEGFRNFDCDMLLSGDVMYDSVLFYRDKANRVSTILQQEGLKAKPFVLLTLHRAENTNDPKRLRDICSALLAISKKIEIICPLHPRTRNFLQSQKIDLPARMIEPVGYFDMLALLENCRLVMTDSGGLQKEAYFFNKYCLTLRDQTEWLELVASGVNTLVGANTDQILQMFDNVIDKKVIFKTGLYGDGHAAAAIVNRLQHTRSA